MDARPLKGNNAVAAALRSPLRLSSGPLAVTIGFTEAPSSQLSYVVSASRRVIRRAVVRNRIKRLLREALRRSVRLHGTQYAAAGLSTVFAVWRTPPAASMRLRLSDVEPHVQSLLRRASAGAQPSNVQPS
ncbi:MAG: hypothetical protein FGM24_09815 [Candidatus Kapabacteria bacterium]|nr:hypothetical protein [Candidatus Kapabacteria bacterium]